MRSGLLLAAVFVAAAGRLTAAEGPPVAVRFWPLGGVSVEPYDGRSVAYSMQREDRARMSDRPAAEIDEPGSGRAVAVREDGVAAEGLPARTTLLETGGLRVVVVQSAGFTAGILQAGTLNDAQKEDTRRKFGRVDVLAMPGEDEWNADVAALTELLRPGLAVLPKTATGRPEGVREIAHNTLAASPREGVDAAGLIALGESPYEMSEEVAGLFAAKETACEASRAVFASLSAAQMNHRPADGSHTPRWNAEHMRGRELLFFSQIYHALDPAVPVMNTNPAQMPPDYRAAHPDWSGEREAEEMRRVEAFTRRFAYLLDGLDLDVRAPGSRFWTPRGLLEQMDRHYAEHTANVKKKFEAADWPAE